tara:strand:- start:480 stop:773 length:294 start_codon:yes stop_codon:yes gene_type:complete
MKRENITNPDKTPVDGDWIRDTLEDGTVVEHEFHEEFVETEEEKKAKSKEWRDYELQSTDLISTITDHPDHAAYKTYRQKLRDWPSTSDFPDTKPTL